MAKNVIHIEKWAHQHTPTEEELRQILVKEGADPFIWSNEPGDVYAAHEHTYQKTIYIVSGSITFGFPIDGQPITLKVGDRLDLPARIQHNAVVGSDGVVCLEAQR